MGSPTFGHWVGYKLTADNGDQLYIPPGFAHGFMTLMPGSEIIYKCDQYYHPQSEGAIRWDDPTIGVAWPLDMAPVLSEKDALAPLLDGFDSPFVYKEPA